MKTESLLFLFFRRMRVPLVVLITAYAVATVGFTLIPGLDDQGQAWRMSLFEAFYVVSYTGSTIGFGELPYEFTAGQRMWAIVSIYLTVFAWLFSIGSIISLLQDPVYMRALRRTRLSRSIRTMNQPFYLVCGFGDTGRLLVRALAEYGHPVVVVDRDRDKIETLEVEDLGASVTAFAMDARVPENLVLAGLRSRWCAGVIAVTGEPRTNLRIAISTRLLNHSATVHARADNDDVAANLRSFETDHVINPVEEFIHRLGLALTRPDLFRLYHWLFSGPFARPVRIRPPRRGRWIVCGFGPVGRAAASLFKEHGMDVVIVDPRPEAAEPSFATVAASGTQAEHLHEAGIDGAAGLLATTANDADNLSIIMTARQINPEIFLGGLENGFSMHPLYRAAECDLIAQPALVVAGAMLGRISSALVEPFIECLLERDNQFARDLLARLLRHQADAPPEFAAGRLSARRAPAVVRALESGRRVPAGALLADPCNRARRLPLEVLLIRRDDEDLLCPPDDFALAVGDRILLGGRKRAARRLRSTLESDAALDYVLTGQRRQKGWVWQWLEQRGDGERMRG